MNNKSIEKYNSKEIKVRCAIPDPICIPYIVRNNIVKILSKDGKHYITTKVSVQSPTRLLAPRVSKLDENKKN